MNDIITVICIGIGATAVMDIWLLLLRRMGVQTLNFAFIGRWVGHLLRGRFRHDAIARSEPIPAELALGWITHYAIGVAFAALLVRWSASTGRPARACYPPCCWGWARSPRRCW